MSQASRIAPFAATLIIAVILQLIFIIPDIKDTPTKAVTEFTKAYFHADKSMADRLCKDARIVDGIDVVDRYIYQKTREASERGYGMFFMTDSVYNLKSQIIRRDGASVEVRVTGKAKPLLKSFFTGEKEKTIDEVVRLVNDNGRWLICGNVFSIASL
jgi:hypothetical protein